MKDLKYKKMNNLNNVSKLLGIKYDTIKKDINNTLLNASNIFIANCFYEEKEQQFYIVNEKLIIYIKKNKIFYIILENGSSYYNFNRIIKDVKDF